MTTSPDKMPTEESNRMTAASEMLGRLGALSMELRYSEADEGTDGPLVWIAIAEFKGAPYQVNAGTHPVIALEKLLEQLIDGGKCQHCGRPTALLTDLADDNLLLNQMACVYQYDPELKTYRRSCEGDAP